MAKKGGQVAELKAKLNDINLQVKQQAIRRIIDAMTRGKDVSMLFMDVVKNMQTPSLQLKKLIYLYVMSYAKSHPDLAILGINTLRKDAVDKSNPFLRGLAVRTMGCIRIKDITEYLCDPLKKALKDEDAYVRKTGALCVPKLYEVSPELVFQQGFLKLLENLLNDGNATVVSNAVASLAICSQLKGEPLITLTSQLVQKLLTAMNDCNEWGVVYILDTLAGYIPSDPQQTQNIMQRVSSRLAHSNSAVSLSAIRLVIKYMDYLSNPESIRNYNNKISAPLISMITRIESQISYMVLKTINLVLQKRPLLLPKQLQVFFVNYHDPLYVKMQKLQVLGRIANNENILMILHHLKECIQQVDVQFVRKAVRTMGRCAIKLEKMADKCVQSLWDVLKTKVTYVVQQSVIVIRDIFRKYPMKYQGLLGDICDNLKCLDDPEAKASIVWIIGEYVQMIENADQLLTSFAENFKDEADVVQQQILVSCMKLYLHRPSDGQQLLKDVFRYVTKECENPDLRDRGYIYWRLLSTNPKLAKAIVLKERPLISEQSYTLQTELLESLIQNIGTLSSVYCKQPQDFVKKLKDNANAREVIEEDAEQLLAKQQVEVEQQQNQQKVSYAQNQPSLLQNTPSVGQQPQGGNLLDGDDAQVPSQQQQQPYQTQQQQKPQKSASDSLLDDVLGGNEPQPTTAGNLLDLIDNNNDSGSGSATTATNNKVQAHQFQTSVNQSNLSDPTSASYFATTVNANQSGVFNFFDNNNQQQEQSNIALAYKNIAIPLVVVLPDTETSREGRYTGLSISAAFQREGPKIILQMEIQNIGQQQIFSDFALKLNANAFKLGYGNISISEIGELGPGQHQQLKLELNTENKQAELAGWPYSIDCALRTIDDVFVFKVPMSLSVTFVGGFSMEVEQYKSISVNPENTKKQEALQNNSNIEQFVEKLENNHLSQVFRKDNVANELMSYGCLLVSGVKLIVDIIFEKSSNAVNVQMTGPNETVLAYFNHALAMIVNL